MSFINIEYRDLKNIRNLKKYAGEPVYKNPHFTKTQVKKAAQMIADLLKVYGYSIEWQTATTGSIYITGNSNDLEKDVFIRISDHFKADDVYREYKKEGFLRVPYIIGFDSIGVNQFKSFEAHITGKESIQPTLSALTKYISK